MVQQLTKVQYIQSIEIIGGNLVITDINAAQIILSSSGVVTFDSGIMNAADSTTVIKALIDPNNVSD